jgi:uncharacterized coiled-coil DUF342 family protein
MNTLKTIYDKLGDKTELAKHEVELGLNQELEAVIKKISAELEIADKSLNTLSALKLQADKEKVKSEESMKKLISLYNQGLPIYTKIDKMGEELDVVIPNLDKYAQIFRDVEQEVSQIKMTIK